MDFTGAFLLLKVFKKCFGSGSASLPERQSFWLRLLQGRSVEGRQVVSTDMSSTRKQCHRIFCSKGETTFLVLAWREGTTFQLLRCICSSIGELIPHSAPEYSGRLGDTERLTFNSDASPSILSL